jgi:hypothetical protein
MTLLLDPGGGAALTFDVDSCIDRHAVEAPPVPEPRRTLDDVLSETWEGLLAAAPARCPVCAATMAPRWSAGAGVVGGRCENCDSELA